MMRNTLIAVVILLFGFIMGLLTMANINEADERQAAQQTKEDRDCRFRLSGMKTSTDTVNLLARSEFGHCVKYLTTP